MVAIPSVAMDVYNDFFARHDLTWFCQISLLKHVMTCPYQDPLSVVMERAYKLGNFNASLFATEGHGIGWTMARACSRICMRPRDRARQSPVSRAAGRLHPGLGRRLPQLLLNVPLTTALLTHGAGLLFLLWYVTPRAVFEPAAVAQPAALAA